jgi:hypothetical protein
MLRCRVEAAFAELRDNSPSGPWGPNALLHHSERGSQYTSEQFHKLTADHGVICSMSRSGNVWDNAAMEASSLRSKPSAAHARRIGRSTKQRLMCSPDHAQREKKCSALVRRLKHPRSSTVGRDFEITRDKHSQSKSP